MLDENEIEPYFEKKFQCPKMKLDRVQCTNHIKPDAVGQVHWSGYSEPGRFRIWEKEGTVQM